MRRVDRREFLASFGAGAAALTAAGTGLGDALATAEAGRGGGRALRQLRRDVRGRVLLPGDPGYEPARRVQNARFSGLRPAAIVEVDGPEDVQAVMRWAARFDVEVRARSGGHSYGGYSSTDGGVVVDLRRLNSVGTHDGGRVATIESGVPLIRMYDRLARRGLTVPAGSCPSVGISGLALGGGMGFASRRFGLTCDMLRAARIVTPDGKLRRIDARSEPDLFWACRGGGGGNFGIVTELSFRTRPVRRAAYYGASWPWEQADRALDAWQRLTDQASQDLCPFFTLAAGGTKPMVRSAGQFFGTERELRRALKPLTDVDGISLTLGTMDYGDLMRHWAGCEDRRAGRCAPRAAEAFFAASDFVERALGSAGRRELLEIIEERQAGGGSGVLLFNGYGGAINRVGATETAFVHRDQLYSVQYFAGADRRSERAGASRWVGDARRRMRPYVSGQAYQNYIDPTLKGWKRAYYGRNYARLAEVKARYDPDRRMRFRQGISAPSARR